MFTKTGLRVRETRSRSLAARTDVARKLPPLDGPVPIPLRPTLTNKKSRPHRAASSNDYLLRGGPRSTSVGNIYSAKSEGAQRAGSNSGPKKPNSGKSRNRADRVLVVGAGHRRGSRERGRSGRPRSGGFKYGDSLNSIAVESACLGIEGSSSRKKRPEWDDSLRDHSEYRLTPEEAVQRKKSLVSKHNTLVFGLGHTGRSGAALASKRLLALVTGTEEEEEEESGVHAAAAIVVTGSAVEVARRRTSHVKESRSGTRADDEHGCEGRDREASDCSNTSRGSASGQGNKTAGLIRSAKEQGKSVNTFVGLGDIGGGEIDETLCLEEHSKKNNGGGVLGGGGGGSTSVNDVTATSVYRYRHLAIASADEHNEEGSAAVDNSDFLGLNGIEVGIQAFSQRVLQLETDRKDGFDDLEHDGKPNRREKGGGEGTQAPALVALPSTADVALTCPTTAETAFPVDMSGYGHAFGEQNSNSDDADDFCDGVLSPRKTSPNVGHPVSSSKRSSERQRDLEALPLRKRQGGEDGKGNRADDVVSRVHNSSPCGTATAATTTDLPVDYFSNECLIERIGLLEAHVRGLRFGPEHQAMVVAGMAGEEDNRGREEGVLRPEAPSTAELCAVISDLLSLSGGLLQRATVAEQRLRDCDRDEKSETRDGGGTGIAVASADVEEAGPLPRARAKSTVMTLPAVSSVGGQCPDQRNNSLNCDRVPLAAKDSNDVEMQVENPNRLRIGPGAVEPTEALEQTSSSRLNVRASTTSPATAALKPEAQQKCRPTTAVRRARSRAILKPPLFLGEEDSVEVTDDGSEHHQRRTRGKSPLQRLRSASSVSAKDCWGEALDAVSSLVANPPSSAKALPAAMSPGESTTVRPIRIFGANQRRDPSRTPSPSGFNGAIDGIGSDVLTRHIRPRPRVVLAPIDPAALSTSISRATRPSEEPEVSGVSNIKAATPAVERAPVCGTPVPPTLVGVRSTASAARAEGFRLRKDFNIRGSIGGALATPAPTPVEKPRHPFERRGNTGGRHLRPVRSPSPRWPYQHTIKAREMNALASSPSFGFGPGGAGDVEGAGSVVAGGQKSKREKQTGGALGVGFEVMGADAATFASPAVGEWYTPPSS